MNLRRGTVFDAAAILALLIEMHKSMPSSATFPVDLGKAAELITRVLAHGLCYVVDDDEEGIIGSVGGFVNEPAWWSKVPALGDTWFYVSSEHRSSKAAVMLVDAFISEGQRIGVPVQLAHVNGNDLERKDKFFERKGLVKMGSFYFMPPPEKK